MDLGYLGMNYCLQLLILLFAILHSSTCVAENEKIYDSTLKSSKCSNLDTDESQDNTFILDKLMCCMCPKGTHYAGICNATHPNTTVCESCEDGTYIEFEANLETKCHTKNPIPCRHPLIYHAGTVSEKPKCICPLGMIEIGRRCIPTKKPTVTETTSSTVRSTKVTVPTTTKRPTTAETKITESILMSRILSSSTMQSSTTIEPSNGNHSKTEQETTLSTQNNNEMSYPNGVDNKLDRDGSGKGMNTAFVIISCIVLVIIIVSIVFFCKYRHHNSTDHSNDKPGTDSRSTLIVGIRTTSTPPTPRRVEEQQGFENQATPLTERTPAQQQGFESSVPLLTPVVVEELSHESENPETINLAGPIRHSPQNRRTECDQLVQEPSDVTLLVVDVEETQREDPVLSPIIIERNKKFAKEVAKKFGSVLPSNSTLTVFRSIMGDDVDDVAIKDLQDEYKNNLRELIYQLMLLAISVVGVRLTPDYLLQKVKDVTPKLQSLVDIIEDELKEPYML